MKRSLLKRGKPMRKVSAKRKAHRASAEGQKALEYMGAVKQLPCCVCGAPPPSIAHHCIHDRCGTRKASDFDTIPLCSAHHDYPHNTAIHSGKETWRQLHGADHSYIEETRRLVAAMKEGSA